MNNLQKLIPYQEYLVLKEIANLVEHQNSFVFDYLRLLELLGKEKGELPLNENGNSQLEKYYNECMDRAGIVYANMVTINTYCSMIKNNITLNDLIEEK